MAQGTNRSLVTSIRAAQGEAEAYKAVLTRGEIGLQRPGLVNESGVDFITARLNARGLMEIVMNDVKTSTMGQFPAPAQTVPPAWIADLQSAIGPERLSLGNAALEQAIRDAASNGRVVARQLNVDYSPKGQGRITGF